MSLLKKLTIKNLKLNKKRTIVTIIGIILSVSLITAVTSMYTSFIQSIINFEISSKGNFHTVFYSVPVNDINIFKNNRKIESIYLTKDIGYANINSKNAYKPYVFIKAFNKESLSNLAINLVEGRMPTNDSEILIPTHLKTNGRINLKVGDEITLDVGKRIDSDNIILNQNNPLVVNEENISNEKIIETTKKTYTIVGIINRPSNSIESYQAPGYTFITYLDDKLMQDKVDLFVKYNKKDVKNAYKITANILDVDEELFERANLSTISYEETQKYYAELQNAKYSVNINKYLISFETNPISNSNIEGLGIVVCIVIAIIIFTSVFCIKNSFDISITEKTKQYGVLRSIGATKKQIKNNVFFEATILGLIGIPIGLLSGLLASYILIYISNYYLNGMLNSSVILVFKFSYYSLIIGTILGIITIYLSAMKSAKKSSKTSLIDSIRNSANIEIKAKKIKSPKYIFKLFGIGGEISYKNIKRNKKKYRTTVISIIVSVFVFIALSSFMNIGFDTIKNEIKTSEYNIYLNTSSVTKDNYEKFIATTNLNNIEEYTILREEIFKFNCSKYNQKYIDYLNYDSKTIESIFVFALGNEPYKKYLESLNLKYEEYKDKAILVDNYLIGKYNEKESKIIYQKLQKYAYQDGDELQGEINNQELNLKIGKVTTKRPFGLQNREEAYLIISDDLLNNYSTKNSLSIYYNSTNANSLQDKIDEVLDGEEYNLNNIAENAQIMKNVYILMGIFLYGFIIVISLIGITNIFNTITTSMALRKQEFAMLKSIGMTSKEFKRMIRLESLFIGLKALIIGIPIGLILSYLIYYALKDNSGLSYHLPISAIIICILTVFILISLIMKYSINKINKQNTIETIRNENI